MPSAEAPPLLVIDAAEEVTRLSRLLHDDVLGRLRRRGAVVGCSGGVDSSVVLALCARALGPDRVVALLLPERESSPDSLTLARSWAGQLGVEAVVEDITPALEAAGCYRRRDEAIVQVFPDFGPGWKSKITLPTDLLAQDTLNVFSLTVVDPDGAEHSRRMPPDAFAQVVAASNFKQRTRMAYLYYHGELRSFAVVGTANRDEHDLGFFVKYGDGGVDVAPIVHLHKVEIYRLAEALDVPSDIRQRTPTSDTYSAGSTQEEFFFRLPFELLDPIWAGDERGLSAAEIARAVGLETPQVERVLRDLSRKRRTTAYLRAPVIDYRQPAPDGRTAP